MGGGKETPRQKMIGLMYLVLMALLAMNVSKEIINSFVVLGNKMESQNKTFITSNGDLLDKFKGQIATLESQKAGKEEIEKVKEIQAQANKIRQSTLKNVNEMMTYAKGILDEGVPGGKWVETDDAGFSYVVNLMDPKNDYSKKDDYDIATRQMVDEGKGQKLLDLIYNYRDSLAIAIGARVEEENGKKKEYSFTPPADVFQKVEGDTTWETEILGPALETVHEDDRPKILEIYRILTFPKTVENHGEQVPWVQGQFDHAPIVAAAALFTSFKGQMLQAEGVALQHMVSKSDVPPFTFDTIEASAFASTGYVNSGDSVDLKVMIAAYDSKAQSRVRYWLDDTAKTGEPIMIQDITKTDIKLGGGVGKHRVVGEIEIKEKGVKKWKPWNFRYEVGSPGGSVANTELNVLYRGYPNQVQASGSGYPEITASCQGCTSFSPGKLKDGSSGYIAQVGRGTNTVTINVMGKDDNGSTQIESKKFRCLDLPPPRVFVTGVDPFASSVSRVKMASGFFGVKLFGAPIDIQFAVTGGKVTLSVQGVSKSFPFSGNKMPAAAAGLIRQLRPGSQVMIEPQVSSGGKTVKVAAISYKVL